MTDRPDFYFHLRHDIHQDNQNTHNNSSRARRLTAENRSNLASIRHRADRVLAAAPAFLHCLIPHPALNLDPIFHLNLLAFTTDTVT
jgi:hypothetical protein